MGSIDARQLPGGQYESSGNVWDTLSTTDTASPLVEASNSGDIESLRNLLSQPEWAKIALEEQLVIHSKHDRDPDRVGAVPMSNLHRALLKAVLGGHAAIVSTLLAFAWQNRVDRDSVISRWVVSRTLSSGRADVFEALALADPSVVKFNVHHQRLPLDIAVQRRDTEMVAVLLRHGAPLIHPDPERRGGSYSGSYLCESTRAEGTRMTELLLEYGAPVARSGALHLAAERGLLETMHLLMRNGADLDELLPADTLLQWCSSLLATWTPMHFAAATGQVAAIELLKSKGARSDVVDQNGKTPAQVLAEGDQGIQLESLF